VIAALLVLLLGAASAPSAPAPPGEGGEAAFALVVGVNRSIDKDVPALRYADDDAARYLDLFRALGARTYLVSRLDDHTRALHAQAWAEAFEPRRAGLREAIARLAADVAQARARRVRATVYFVYAGHGKIEDGRGYLALEDARLFGDELGPELFDRVGADRFHLIVDACNSYFLALGRGPGGRRRAFWGFAGAGGEVSRDGRVGLLLSTSSARESHEWAGFQAGVFSHEVRSGLYGAADADGDGRVGYREIAAFVGRANASVQNERYRSDVLARPPAGDELFVDLRPGLTRRVEVDTSDPAHFRLEDTRGVRIADFHNQGARPVRIVRPVGSGRLYLRRMRDDREYVIAPGADVVRTAELALEPPRTERRGAADDAFDALFALPFGPEVVAAFELAAGAAAADADVALRPRAWTWGHGLIGAGTLAGAAGVAALVSAHALAGGPDDAHRPQQAVAQENRAIRRRNLLGAAALGIGGAAVTAGLFWLWYDSRLSGFDLALTTGGVEISIGRRF
jgi:hypothetical protein